MDETVVKRSGVGEYLWVVVDADSSEVLAAYAGGRRACTSCRRMLTRFWTCFMCPHWPGEDRACDGPIAPNWVGRHIEEGICCFQIVLNLGSSAPSIPSGLLQRQLLEDALGKTSPRRGAHAGRIFTMYLRQPIHLQPEEGPQW